MAVTTPSVTNLWHRSQPQAAPPMEVGRTLVDLFFDRTARWAERPALRHRQGDSWSSVTWADYGAAVREVAAGLVAIPNRYMHSAVEMISLEDIDRAADLLAQFALGLNADDDFTP